MGSENVTHIGQHRVWLVPPDIVVTEWHGDVSGDEMRAVYRLYDTLVPGNGDLLGCSIMKDSGPPTAAARRAAAEEPNAQRFRALAFVGATFHFRVIATMVGKAHRALTRNAPPLAFFDEMPEAIAWLECQRRPATSG